MNDLYFAVDSGSLCKGLFQAWVVDRMLPQQLSLSTQVLTIPDAEQD